MEIKILKEGVHEEKGDSTYPICSTVVLIKGEKNIIVDTGNLGFEKEIIKSLEKEGLKAEEDIDYVILTHNHNDHASNNYLFKNAKIVSYDGIWYNKKVDIIKDDKFSLPNLERINVSGHTIPHYAVIVKADKTYIIAGDAIRYDMLEKRFANEQEKKSAKKILDIANVIIPGHGPVIEGKKLNEFKKLFK